MTFRFGQRTCSPIERLFNGHRRGSKKTVERIRRAQGKSRSIDASVPTDPYDMRARKLMDLMHNPTWLRDAAERTLQRSLGKHRALTRLRFLNFARSWKRTLKSYAWNLSVESTNRGPCDRCSFPRRTAKCARLGYPACGIRLSKKPFAWPWNRSSRWNSTTILMGSGPNRSAHYAVWQCQQLMWQKFTWVIEGDVKACFDNISHKAILKVLREKILDNRFLELIKRFLKAGVSVEGCFQPTENGVPQGGVILSTSCQRGPQQAGLVPSWKGQARQGDEAEPGARAA